MRILSQQINFAVLAAVLTWSLVFGISLYMLSHAPEGIRQKTPWIILSFLVYLACFLVVASHNRISNLQRNVYLLLAVQLASAFAILWLMPADFLPILTVIWVSFLPHITTLRNAVVICTLVVLVWFTLYYLQTDKSSLIFTGLLYYSFHLFAILMNSETRKAEQATEEAQRLNKELTATQNLLAEASKQNERTRIARDLHDLLGHHLTALIINLQVASRLSEGEAKEKVSQCHSVAKLLLSDVREAVSTLRENQQLDFEKMLDLMCDNVPNLTIHRKLEGEFSLEEMTTAKALLSCIQEALTNSLRHSGANDFWIGIKRQQQVIELELYDNGLINPVFKPGNGLKGMQERVSELGGQFKTRVLQNALQINIQLPVAAKSSAAVAQEV